MKIENNRNKLRKFSDLQPGDIFSGSTSIYIKSELLYDTIGEPSNAINLKNGLANCFDEDCLVELIDDVTLVLN
jgi:hypothetical protein